MQPVTLKPGPKLFLAEDGTDVTATAHEHLFSPVVLEKGVLLRDIFKLIAPNPFLLGVYQQGYAKELCAEALKGPLKLEEELLDYIELTPTWTLHSRARVFETVGSYDVNGMGKVAPADIYAQDSLICPKGSRVAYGLSLSPVRALLLLEVRVSSSMVIHEADMDSRNFAGPVKGAQEYEIPALTLGQLLREILFELSWHGTPEQTEITAQATQETFRSEPVPPASSDLAEKVMRALGFIPQEAVFETFFERWKSHTVADIYAFLDSLEDEAPANAAFEEHFEGRVALRTEFKHLDACELRKLLREARTPL